MRSSSDATGTSTYWLRDLPHEQGWAADWSDTVVTTYHARDLGESFDFLTWFEYAPQHSARFEELVRRLRETDEWRYVAREVDIRLARPG